VIIYTEKRELVLAFVESDTPVVRLATPELLAECGFVPAPDPTALTERVYTAPEPVPPGVYRVLTLGADKRPQHHVGCTVVQGDGLKEINPTADLSGQDTYFVDTNAEGPGTYVRELVLVSATR
jgi:hypothetical protein